jgi:hypothetical protein
MSMIVMGAVVSQNANAFNRLIVIIYNYFFCNAPIYNIKISCSLTLRLKPSGACLHQSSPHAGVCGRNGGHSVTVIASSA